MIVRPRGTVGGGRAINQQNRLSRQAKENLEEAFEKMGGIRGLVTWGKKNKTEFYKIWARLIPKDVSVNPGQGLEDMLAQLAEMQSGREAEHPRHPVIDVTPVDDDAGDKA